MHELASLTMTTTDQHYVFMWIAVTVVALRPATQLVEPSTADAPAAVV
jgi:hypothetical protein